MPTLDRLDRVLLASLADGTASLSTLAGSVDCPMAELRRRLDALESAGLVRRRADGTVERTESGRRVLAASPAGDRDDRIDTPTRVDRVIDDLDLRPDAVDAVESAFALLRFWGSATPDEIVDATFQEAPAGYDDPDAWWRDCVRDRLAALPGVETFDGDVWRYRGRSETAQSDTDGRSVLGGDTPVFASARHALSSSELSDPERDAVRAALDILRARGQATTAALRQRVRRDRPDPSTARADWSDQVGDALAAVPGVTRPDDRCWQYHQPDRRGSRRQLRDDPTDDADTGSGP